MHPEQLHLPIKDAPPVPQPEKHEVLLVHQKHSKPQINFDRNSLENIQVIERPDHDA